MDNLNLVNALRVHNALLASGPIAIRNFCARHGLSNAVCQTLEARVLQGSLQGGTKNLVAEKPKKPEVVSTGITKAVKKAVKKEKGGEGG